MIWLNPNLPHIYKISDPYTWTKYDIKLISQIVSQNALVPLSQLSSTNNLPNYYQLRYLQLCHAFATQFPHSSCTVVQSGWREHSDLDVLRSLPHTCMRTWSLCLCRLWRSFGPIGSMTSLHWITMTGMTSGISPLAP